MLLRTYLIFLCLVITTLSANNKDTITKVGMYEKQNSILPINLEFKNEYNQTVKLKDAINNKPTVLTINYFDCPGLCSPLLNAVSSVLNKLDLKPYLDYSVITISIEPNDTPKIANIKKESLLRTITKPFPPQTWSFLTTNQKNIDEITDALGFKYEKRVRDGVVDYLHPGLIVVVSPNGKIIRYLNGIQYLPFDLKLALLEAKEERSGPTIAKTLLYCFAYDAKSKTYIFQAEKVFGSFMFGIIFIFFMYLVKSGRKTNKDGQDG